MVVRRDANSQPAGELIVRTRADGETLGWLVSLLPPVVHDPHPPAGAPTGGGTAPDPAWVAQAVAADERAALQQQQQQQQQQHGSASGGGDAGIGDIAEWNAIEEAALQMEADIQAASAAAAVAVAAPVYRPGLHWHGPGMTPTHTHTQHGLSSIKVALITSDCDAMCIREQQVALITLECMPFRGRQRPAGAAPAAAWCALAYSCNPYG